MKGAKFVVLSLKDIIRNFIFILVGIALLVFLFLMFFKSGNTESVQYTPGTYSSQVYIKGEPLEVFVTVDSDSISEINTSALDDKQMAYYPLIEPTASSLIPKVLEAQSTDIEMSDDSYYTQYVLLTAIDDALDQACKDGSDSRDSRENRENRDSNNPNMDTDSNEKSTKSPDSSSTNQNTNTNEKADPNSNPTPNEDKSKDTNTDTSSIFDEISETNESK